MLDLKELEVVEMSSQEVVEIDGGIIPLLIIGVALLCTSCVPCRLRP